MLTWAWFWYASKEGVRPGDLAHLIPMGCDVAIFYFIASAIGGR